MKKTTKRFMSACAAVALAAVMAFGGIGTSVANAATFDASKLEANIDIEEAKALIEEAQAEIDAAVQYAQENYKDAYADAYKKVVETGAIDNAIVALTVAKEAVNAYTLPEEAVADITAKLGAEEAQATLEAFSHAKADAVKAMDKVIAELSGTDVETFDGAVEAVKTLWPEAAHAYADLLVIAEKVSPAVKADLEALYNEYAPQVEKAIDDFIAAAEAEIEAIKAEIQAEIEKQIEALEKAIEELEAAVKAEIEAIEAELQAKLDELKAQLEAAEEAVKAEIEAAIEAVEGVLAELEASKAEIEAAVEEAIAAIETAIEDIDATIAELEAAIETAYNDAVTAIKDAYVAAITGEYVVDEDSFYFALGDSILLGENTYADKLANELTETYGLPAYEKTAFDGFRAEDFRYLLDDTYALDAYGVAVTKEEADEAREAVIEQIEEADLISISFGNDNFTSFVASQFPTPKYEMDWASIVTEEGVPYVEEALAEVVADMATGDEAVDAMIADLVESYAYAFAGFATNYTEVINAIHAINPEAEVVVTGMFNPIDNLVVEGENLGEYVDYFIDLSNTMFTVYAMVTPNTTFVEIPDAEAAIDAAEGLDYVDYFMAILSADESLLPTEIGHEYICDQILAAENITVAEEEEGLKGDVNLDGKVNAADTAMLYDYVLKKVELSAIQLENADVTGEGDVNAADTTMLYDYVLKKITW